MNRHCSRRRLPGRSGHTLTELTVALPIMAMLALGMASAIKLAARSIPDGTSVSDSTLSAARAMDRFAGEVAFATAIDTDVTSGSAARQVTFEIPDRDGQTPATETVTYSWSGIPGDPLLRAFNGTTSTVAANVHEFALSYEKRVTPAAVTATTTSAESQLIFSFWLTNVADSPITTSDWCGQYFLPLLSPDVVGWNVTKVQFLAKLNGHTTGQTAVQIRTANNRLPTSTVLDQQILLENTLTYFHTVKTLAFSNVPMQSRNQGLCLVLKLAANSPSGFAQYREGGTPMLVLCPRQTPAQLGPRRRTVASTATSMAPCRPNPRPLLVNTT